jgi:hypothetical protein
MRLDNYRLQGWTVERGLIRPETLDRIAREIFGVFGRAARSAGLNIADPVEHETLSSLMLRLFDADRAAYLGAAKQTQFLSSVQRLCVGEEISAVIENLGIETQAISTRPVIHYISNAIKFVGGYDKTPIHQDWRSVQGSLDSVIVWLPLFNVGLDDFPLEVIPKSHRLGLLPSTDHPFGHQLADGVVAESDFAALPLARGDTVFFSSFLVHRTGARGGDRVRVALSFRYNNANEPHFVDRHYPVPYTYRPDMRLVTPDFPTPQDMERHFPPPDPPDDPCQRAGISAGKRS